MDFVADPEKAIELIEKSHKDYLSSFHKYDIEEIYDIDISKYSLESVDEPVVSDMVKDLEDSQVSLQKDEKEEIESEQPVEDRVIEDKIIKEEEREENPVPFLEEVSDESTEQKEIKEQNDIWLH